ncbi:neuropeptide CCHamide-1 receptor-like isoform X1 [Asterias amurensis]|uniref:neuropeptide CCHamide-1 receptor-like isoform X1 n=1 Tax=Asterias amurensis TaxID=7602 RepID=UPI003AB870B5
MEDENVKDGESEYMYFSSASFYLNYTGSYEFSIPWRWNLTVVLIMAVFGITVNMALLLVIVLNQHMRTISNLLVANLAVADLIMFFFSVPFDIVQWNVSTWPRGIGGTILCKLGSAVWGLAQVLCVASLTAVSVERYCSLRWPRMQVKRTFLILGAVWLIAIVFAIPILKFSNVEHFGKYISFCYVVPPWGTFARSVTTTYCALTYVLPVIVISCCYVGMASTLMSRNDGADTASVRARRLLSVVVLILAISFVVCWFPIQFVNLYVLFMDPYSMSFEFITRCWEVGHVLVYVNSCLNPLVVFIISGLHRKPLVGFFTKNRKKPSTSNQNDPYSQIQDEASLSETEHVDLEPLE